MDIAGLKKNVGFLNWAVGIIFLSGLSALVALYFLLASRIDDRYEKTGDKLDQIVDRISDLRIAVASASASDSSASSVRQTSEVVGSNQAASAPIRR